VAVGATWQEPNWAWAYPYIDRPTANGINDPIAVWRSAARNLHNPRPAAAAADWPRLLPTGRGCCRLAAAAADWPRLLPTGRGCCRLAMAAADWPCLLPTGAVAAADWRRGLLAASQRPHNYHLQLIQHTELHASCCISSSRLAHRRNRKSGQATRDNANEPDLCLSVVTHFLGRKSKLTVLSCRRKTDIAISVGAGHCAL
jgi:hypothetical protein